MSERTTGATPEQIEAAADDKLAFYMSRYPNANQSDIRNAFRSLVTDYAESIVRPDQRIVNVADLRMMAVLLRYDEYNAQHLSDDERSLSDRITALIGDAE